MRRKSHVSRTQSVVVDALSFGFCGYSVLGFAQQHNAAKQQTSFQDGRSIHPTNPTGHDGQANACVSDRS